MQKITTETTEIIILVDILESKSHSTQNNKVFTASDNARSLAFFPTASILGKAYHGNGDVDTVAITPLADLESLKPYYHSSKMAIPGIIYHHRRSLSQVAEVMRPSIIIRHLKKHM